MPPAADTPVVGVILAAGKGTRIYPFSATLPKPILPVGNRPLLDYQLDIMREAGIRDVFIVIGHLGYTIVRALGDGARHGLNIRYVEQADTLGIAHALGKLEPLIDSPFVLFLGDIYFVTDALRPAIDEVITGDVSANLISKIETSPEMIKRNFAIIEDRPGRVRQVIEKPRHVRNNLKGCGIYVFDQHVFDAIRRTPRTAMRDEYEITDSIQILINDGLPVGHKAIVHDDFNLTVPEDLLAINLLDLDRRGVPALVGEGVTHPPGARIEHSVIGDGSAIGSPIRLRNSLVFPGTTVSSTTDLDGVIVVDDNVISARPREEL
jgi:NDP-sugar pyrophosphorylase family protein